ncbi:MAG: serpin family protein [Bacteroidaceae bacterium]|nr:serpin family protein [Bacteroidaceae bacterium]
MKTRDLIMIVFAVGTLCSACSSDEEVPEIQPQPQEEEEKEQTEATALRPLSIVENESTPFNAAQYAGSLTDDERTVGSGLQDFALRFVRESFSASDNQENIVVSPLSAGILLSSLANGCNGQTLQEICDLLNMKTSDLNTLNSYQRKIATQLDIADDSVCFLSNNALWMQHKLPVYLSFINDSKNFYSTEVEAIDFADQAAGGTINRWCREKTKGLIERIVEDGPMDCVLSMANALYFKAPWTDGFHEEGTKPGTFTNQDGTEKEVQMMHRKDQFFVRYAKAVSFDLAALDFGQYSHKNYSMVFCLPHKGVSLKACLEGLDATAWNEAVSSLSMQNVDLMLPRFEVSQSQQLKPVFQKMGLNAIFDVQQADLSRLSPQPLAVSDIQQNAVLKVNEKGAEAAAVTWAGMTTSDGPGEEPEYIPFHVDRPFFFAIQENQNGNILFMGVVRNL